MKFQIRVWNTDDPHKPWRFEVHRVEGRWPARRVYDLVGTGGAVSEWQAGKTAAKLAEKVKQNLTPPKNKTYTIHI